MLERISDQDTMRMTNVNWVPWRTAAAAHEGGFVLVMFIDKLRCVLKLETVALITPLHRAPRNDYASGGGPSSTGAQMGKA